jgi:hypothetical protein
MGAFWAFDEKLEKRKGNLHKIVKRKLFYYQTTQNYHHNTLVASTNFYFYFRNANIFKKCFSQRENFCEGK